MNKPDLTRYFIEAYKTASNRQTKNSPRGYPFGELLLHAAVLFMRIDLCGAASERTPAEM